ncbi:MAG: transcription elongation factor GreA [Pseudomonadota bacterium]|nr:transcription elongation factor GreA [Pseudomonadota bacterium]
MEKAPMTLQGFDDLQTELKRLKTTERPEVIKAIAAAREHGDLSENAEYHAARERQAFIEGRVGIIEDLLSRAEVIDVTAIKGKVIKFGAIITIIDEDTEEKSTYQIVGEHEADVKLGKLSVNSPMARAMIGKTVSDSIEVTTPGGTKSYEIMAVKYK